MPDKRSNIYEIYDLKITDHPEAVKLSESKLQAIANYPLVDGKQAVYIVDWSGGNVKHSRGLYTLLGYEDGERDATDLIHDFHPNDGHFVKRIIRGAVRHFANHPAVGSSEFLNLTYRLRKKDGSYIKVLRQSSIISVDATGMPVMNMSFLTDISFISNNNRVEWDIYATKLNQNKLRKEVFKEFVNFFTDREKQVIQCISEGLTNPEIAKKLHISKHTVGTHRKNILAKSECSSAQEMLDFCRTNGII